MTKLLQLAPLSLLVIMLAFPPGGWADEIHLTNGDRLTGTIVHMREDTLILNTTYGGDIKIKWNQVKAFSAGKPVIIQGEEGLKLRGIVDVTESGKLQLQDPDTGTMTLLHLPSVQAINPPPDLRYTGDTSLGGNVSSGNTRTKAVNASTAWAIDTDSHKFRFEARYNFAEQDGETAANNSRGRAEYGYLLTKKWFLNLEQLLEQDSQQDLDLRSTTLGGVGYRFIRTNRHRLRASARMGYVQQKFEDESEDNSATASWRVRWQLWPVPDALQLFHNHEGFKDVAGSSTGFRWNADTGLEVPFYKTLYVKLEFDFRFNSDPQDDRKKSDEAFIFGIGWKIGN